MERKVPKAAKDRLPAVSEAAPLNEGTQLRLCPICGKPAIVAARPFCSKRCADIDLHRWLGGTYAIPAEEKDIDQTGPDDDVP